MGSIVIDGVLTKANELPIGKNIIKCLYTLLGVLKRAQWKSEQCAAEVNKAEDTLGCIKNGINNTASLRMA